MPRRVVRRTFFQRVEDLEVALRKLDRLVRRVARTAGTGGGGGGGAPLDATYLVGASDPDLTSEIVVGSTPGGELGGSWTSPTVDSVHGPEGLTHHVNTNDPSAGEKAALAGTTGTPGSGNRYVTDSDGRLPSTGEKAALAGTSGTPGSGNKYVTDSDSRLGAGASGSAGGDLSGTYPNPVVLKASTTFALTGVISPSQLTGNQNNYNPTNLSVATILRLSSDASRTISGLAGGSSGRVIVLTNVGSNDIVLSHEGTGSTAANRFVFPNSSSVTLKPNDGLTLEYDGTVSRWVMTGRAAATVAGPDADVTVDGTGAAGTAGLFSRSQHGHKFDTTGFSPINLVLPRAASPAQTADGSAVWDSDDDKLTVGTGSGRKTLVNDDDSRLTDARTPTGAAGGDLSGTYPNPSVQDDSHSHTASTVPQPDAKEDGSGVVTDPTAFDYRHGLDVTTSGTEARIAVDETELDHGTLGGTRTHAGDTLTPTTLDVPAAASPAQTAEGRAVWDSDDDRLTVGTGSGRKTLVNDDDSRLSDARTPTAHHATHEPGGSDPMTVDAAAATGSLRTLGTGSAQAAAGDDARLSDTRTPTSHHTTHEPGGGDAMAVDAAAATGSLRTLGTGAQQAAAGTDSRLSDARTPTAHAASHKSGGGDTVAGVLNGFAPLDSGLLIPTSYLPVITDTIHGSRGSGLHADSHAALTIGADAEHTLAAQVLSGVDASTSQKGHASFSSKFSATSGAIDLAADGHGAAEHANLTRTFYLDASNGSQADSATATNVGTAPDVNRAMSLADAATQGVVFPHFVIPSDAVAGQPLTIQVVWAPAATDASSHAVRWSADALALTAGTLIDAAGTTTNFTGLSQANTAKATVYESAQQVLASVSAGNVIRLDLRRVGADAADTYVGAVTLLGVIVGYTANQ